MDEFFGHTRSFWVIVVSLFIIVFLFSFILLPKVVFLMVNNQNNTEVVAVDYHATVQFNLNESEKMTEVEEIFSDVFMDTKFKKINVIVTDTPQSQKINWIDDSGQLVNHLGYDVYPEGSNLSVYLYNNTIAFSHWGWDVEKIARENELLLIKALMYYRGWSVEKINEEAKKVFLSLHEQYPEPLFLMTYAF